MYRQYIVSGANGFIGEKVVRMLSQRGEKVIGLCRNISSEKSAPITYVSNIEFLNNSEKYMKKNTVFIHLAFARANRGAEELAESLNFTKDILSNICHSENLEKFIYISSQGIYGKSSDIRMTSNKAQPESIYTMAKYAAEKMVEMALAEKNFCILRLDNVIQSQNLIKALAKSAIQKQCIHIIGGKQVFSYIDRDDAAMAIVICACSFNNMKSIYNVGPDKMRVSIIEIANILAHIAQKYGNEIKIVFEADSTELWAGMDSKDFCEEYHWQPQYNIVEMIERVYLNILKSDTVGNKKI